MHKPADILTLGRFATLPKTKMTTSQRAEVVIHHATQLARASDQSVSDIARSEARFAFQQHQLLPQEVIDIFHLDENGENPTSKPGDNPKNNVKLLTRILTEQFTSDLLLVKNRSDTIFDTNAPIEAVFKRDLIEFLQQYPKAGVKLYDFLQSQQHFYPEVDVHLIFEDPEVSSIFLERINASCLEEISAAYRELYAENPDQFVLQFFSSRILSALSAASLTDRTRMRVRKNVQLLMDYLVEQGYQLEKVYILLYKQLASWRSVVTRSVEVREKIFRAYPVLFQEPSVESEDDQDTDELKDPGMLDPRFDFDQMFKSYIRPAMIKARSSIKQLPSHPRHVDVQHKGSNYLVAPERAMMPFKEMADLALSPNPKAFSTKLRTFFTYPHDEQKLDDATLFNILSNQLGIAQDNIQGIYTEGLKVRKANDPKDPILSDFSRLAPIAECTDIRKLIIWTAYPERFAEEYPEHSKARRSIVSNQARRVLESLIRYRNNAYFPEFKNRNANSNMLNDQIKELLNIDSKNILSVPLSFRILMEVDPITQEPITNGSNGDNGHTAYIPIFPGDEDWFDQQQKKDSYIVRHGDRYFKAMPVETKKFLQTTVSVPQPSGDPYTMELLFYSKDPRHHIVTAKSGPSYFLSDLRGKKISDIVRFMPVFSPLNDEQDRAVFMNFCYDFSSQVTKIDDAGEGRLIQNKPSNGQRTEGSAAFAKDRGTQIAGYTIVPGGNLTGQPAGDIETHDADLHSRIGFEIQVMNLSALSISTSDYTSTSHGAAYSPERAFKVLCDHFHPAIIYGSKYADHALRGFRGDQKL